MKKEIIAYLTGVIESCTSLLDFITDMKEEPGETFSGIDEEMIKIIKGFQN